MTKAINSYFLTWEEAFTAGPDIVGGKGWNLGRLDKYGFAVPLGGVLSTASYNKFIEENRLLKTVLSMEKNITISNIGDENTLQKLNIFREEIKNGVIPGDIQEELVVKLSSTGILQKPIAVRSSASAEDSAVASFAGIHGSFLNVRGLENILAAVKDCYASLWTPAAVSYRLKMKIRDSEVFMAVVIMETIKAMSAGIAFSCNPHSGCRDEIIINACYGLGEAVVGGLVEPDEYRLDSVPLIPKIMEKRIGAKEGITVFGENEGTVFISSAEKSPLTEYGDFKQDSQVLPDSEIVNLGLLTTRVFAALGREEEDQDIEWVFDGTRFVLVQARPVTALPRYTYHGLKGQPDIWSNANFRDALPMVQSTLNWTTTRHLINIMLSTPAKEVNYPILQGLEYSRLYQGRAYMNITLMQWEFYHALGVTPKEVNDFTGGHQPEIVITKESAGGIIGSLKRQMGKLRLFRAILKSKQKANEIFTVVDNLDEQWSKTDLRSYSDRELLNALEKIVNLTTETVPIIQLLNNTAGMPLYLLINALEKDFPGRGNALANALMIGKANITSAEHGYRLAELAELAAHEPQVRQFIDGEKDQLSWKSRLPENSLFKQKFRAFMKDYGHRGVYECDIINPRWEEDPSYLFDIIKNTETASLADLRVKQKDKGEKAWQKVNRECAFYRRGLVKKFAGQAARGAELREKGKSELVRLGGYLRQVAEEVGSRLVERNILEYSNDIYHCSRVELVCLLSGLWDSQGLRILVSERKKLRKEYESQLAPDVIIDETPQYAPPVKAVSGKSSLSGLGVAAGRASGAARLIHHPAEGSVLKQGDVLVAPSTDPAWTPLFLRASAVVMETGGFLSHGAIVAREYGIPAVVNVQGAMGVLKDGKNIVVDGDEGKVYLE